MKLLKKLTPYYVVIIIIFAFAAISLNKTVTVVTENSGFLPGHCIIIDAGHGQPDGGATSCTGVLESDINLEIALKLQDFCHLLGFRTIMTRTTEDSVYTEGETIASKKISDVKNRVGIAANTPNAIFVSIHQNHFLQPQYHGAQVFYNAVGESAGLAKLLQDQFVKTINPGSNRKAKRSEGVYIMKNIPCEGILIECGFLSNPEEEALLRTHSYQLKVCAVVATGLSSFLNARDIT